LAVVRVAINLHHVLLEYWPVCSLFDFCDLQLNFQLYTIVHLLLEEFKIYLEASTSVCTVSMMSHDKSYRVGNEV